MARKKTFHTIAVDENGVVLEETGPDANKERPSKTQRKIMEQRWTKFAGELAGLTIGQIDKLELPELSKQELIKLREMNTNKGSWGRQIKYIARTMRESELPFEDLLAKVTAQLKVVGVQLQLKP